MPQSTRIAVLVNNATSGLMIALRAGVPIVPAAIATLLVTFASAP